MAGRGIYNNCGLPRPELESEAERRDRYLGMGWFRTIDWDVSWSPLRRDFYDVAGETSRNEPAKARLIASRIRFVLDGRAK